MFHASITAEALIEGRLNAEAYSPDVLNDLSILRASEVKLSRLGEMVRAPINNSIRNVTEALDAPGAEIPMYRPADISDGWCDCETAPPLPREFEALHSKSRVFPGDIVLGIAGSIAIAGRVSNGHAFGNINGSSARIAPTPRSEGYLLSYLNSRFGRSALLQWAVGAVQRHLNLEDLPDVCVARPCIEVQEFIGSKVRQAEGLRMWAKSSIDAILVDYESVELRVAREAGLHTRVSGKDLRDRLDAEHYPDDVLQLFKTIESSGVASIQSITDDIFSGTTLAASEEQASTLQATVATLGSLFLNDRLRNVVAPRGQGKRLQTHDLAIAAAAHTASYIGRDVTYCVADDQIYPSTEVLVIRPATGGVPSTWLWCFLKSRLGYRQIQACVRGITAHAYPDDICHVRVPLPGAEVADRFHSYDDTMVLANKATKMAKALTNSARFLVEALIEGKVTEAELIAAGKDADADRALLARLWDDGLDGAGTRLLPDIDALFDLIAQVQGTGAES
jgi:type I restriction enzyme S subunit